MTVARILVNIDLKLGLSTDIHIKTSSGTYFHVLDYEGVLSGCHRCHAYGHLLASCPLPSWGKGLHLDGQSQVRPGLYKAPS